MREAQGSPAFQHTALALASDRREFRVRPDPFQSARSCFALEMHYFALHFLLSLRIFYGTYRVRITLFFLALCAFRWAAADGLINGVHFSALAIAERVGR